MSVAALALATLLVTPTPLVPDLEGYLEGSAEAEFHGEMLVACETPDGRRDALFQIAQVDGSVVAWSSQSGEPVVAVAPGRSATSTGESVEASVVRAAAPGEEAAAYETRETQTDREYLGRDVSEVTVQRDGVDRLRMVVDDDTDAVLRTTSYTADGEPYCDRRLLSFEQGAGEVPEVETGDVEPTEPLDDAPDMLPEEVAGFTLADTYPVEEGTMSYYTDGFFSFGLVVTDRPIGFGDDTEVVDVTIAGGDYQRSYEAGRVTVAWTVGEENMALVGDLPPDLTQTVIDVLPEPTRQGFFGRLWEQLFGYKAANARL